MLRSILTLTRQTTSNRLVLIASILVSAFLMTVSVTAIKREPSSPAPVAKAGRLEVEVVTITPEGFEPQQIVRPPGRFILAVRNQSGIDSLTVQLETEQRGKVREKALPLETPYWREVINVPPGKYIFTEVNHPEWILSLTIQ